MKELWRQNIRDSKSLLFCDALKIIGYGLSVLLALMLVLNGGISIGVFGACIAAFKAMQEATKSFLIDLGNIPEKIAFANDYFGFLDLGEDKNGEIKIKGIRECIEVSGISFTYPNSNNYALKSVSLLIKKGEKIIVLGVNGSGKTTLAKLIIGIYPPCGCKWSVSPCLNARRNFAVPLYAPVHAVYNNPLADVGSVQFDSAVDDYAVESGVLGLLVFSQLLEVVSKDFKTADRKGVWHKVNAALISSYEGSAFQGTKVWVHIKDAETVA
jgi:hypothetical protein